MSDNKTKIDLVKAKIDVLDSNAKTQYRKLRVEKKAALNIIKTKRSKIVLLFEKPEELLIDYHKKNPGEEFQKTINQLKKTRGLFKEKGFLLLWGSEEMRQDFNVPLIEGKATLIFLKNGRPVSAMPYSELIKAINGEKSDYLEKPIDEILENSGMKRNDKGMWEFV